MSEDILTDDSATSHKPEKPMVSGPSRRTRLRHWLIKKLARRDMIVLNARFTAHSILPSKCYEDADRMMSYCELDGTPPNIGEYGFRLQDEEESLQ